MRRTGLKLRGAALVLGFTAACSGIEEPVETQNTIPSTATSESTDEVNPISDETVPIDSRVSTATSTSTAASDSSSSSPQTLAVDLSETGRFGVAFSDCPGDSECPTSVREQRVGPLFVRLESFGASGLERLIITLRNEGDQLLQALTVTDVITFSELSRWASSASTSTASSSSATAQPASASDLPVTTIEQLVRTASATTGTCETGQADGREGVVLCTLDTLDSGRTATIEIVFNQDPSFFGEIVNTVSARALADGR